MWLVSLAGPTGMHFEASSYASQSWMPCEIIRASSTKEGMIVTWKCDSISLGERERESYASRSAAGHGLQHGLQQHGCTEQSLCGWESGMRCRDLSDYVLYLRLAGSCPNAWVLAWDANFSEHHR